MPMQTGQWSRRSLCSSLRIAAALSPKISPSRISTVCAVRVRVHLEVDVQVLHGSDEWVSDKVHGHLSANLGVEGAVKAVRDITTGLGWTAVLPPLELTGAPDKAALEACWELGATAAATLAD
jgi:hypothetical protein